MNIASLAKRRDTDALDDGSGLILKRLPLSDVRNWTGAWRETLHCL